MKCFGIFNLGSNHAESRNIFKYIVESIVNINLDISELLLFVYVLFYLKVVLREVFFSITRP